MNRKREDTLAHLTYRDVKERLEKGPVYGLLPTGATEAHGPHLPLLTDVLISTHGARLAAQMLFREGTDAVVLPALGYGVTEYARDFNGTIGLTVETMVSLVLEVIRGAHRTGLKGVVVCNAHLEPANIDALFEATKRATDEGLLASFPNVTRKPHALRLGEEFKSGACHAGRYETSLMLAARPFLVESEVAQGLPANPISLSDAIRAGKTTFLEAGGPNAYFGAPDEATAAEGAELYAEMADIFASGVRGFLTNRA